MSVAPKPRSRDDAAPAEEVGALVSLEAREDASGTAVFPRRSGRVFAWVPASVALGMLLELSFLIVLAATDGYDAARSGEALRILLTFATVGALFLSVHLAFARRPRIEIAVTCALVLLLVAANIGRELSSGSFDYGFAHDNLPEVFTPLGWHIMTSNVGWRGLAILLGVPAVAGLLLSRAPRQPWAGGPRARLFAGSSCAAFLIALPVLRVSTHEPLTAFVASGVRFHAEARAAEALIQGESYPYVRDFVPSEKARAIADEKRPHVILLFLESYNGLFVDKRRADGRPYTPVFDARRRESLSFDYFYGNSVQSSRGHFATLCSLPPVFRGKELTEYGSARLRCLPEVLRSAGYATLFYSATAQPDFERGKIFFERNGFDSAEFQVKVVDPAFWGTGLQDDVFYRRFFARVDALAAAGKPVFAVAANASNHYPFNEGPGHRRDPGEPTARRGDYVASLGAADAWLATFFEEIERRPTLRDAIVVLVGDHSFPADEHGIHFNGLGAYEEAFRTGFLLRWAGRVRPETVRDRAASQIDIAPTIVDLLQIAHKTHFLGQSLVAGEPPRPAPMVQPYDGVRLVAVRYPYKLVRHQAAEQEQLYDLARDPREEHDLLSAGAPASDNSVEVSELRAAILRIHANQALLRANRVWPAGP